MGGDAKEAGLARVKSGAGFFAALDQSGGSTPGALRQYGVPEELFQNEDSMFHQIQLMRERVITSNAFSGQKVIAAILFEKTMHSTINGKALPAFLWEDKGIVPFLKMDQGLAIENDGVQLMKPISGLDSLLADALQLGIVGTKMRSVIKSPSKTGIAAIVRQQFALAAKIAAVGLVPILEPEVSIDSPDRDITEQILFAELTKALEALGESEKVMLKLTLPYNANMYLPLIEHPKVLRVVTLSGGYSRQKACEHLAMNQGLIASFSRALLEDLHYSDSNEAFERKLGEAVDEIYAASVVKTAR